MIGFGFWDGRNNGFSGVNDNVLNLLDFPMESLEGDGDGEDLDSKLRRLGPITWEALQRLSSAPTLDVRHGSLDLQSNSSPPSEQTCQLNQKPEFFEETSSINNSHNSISKEQLAPHEPHSPISALSSSGSSYSSEGNTPISLNPPINNSGLRKSKRKKKKLSQLFAVKKQRPSKEPALMRKCTHCGIKRTPQWREGPMGPKTLCNACGVRYRSGRLLPEYRPAGSPTFVPSLHSNNHKKIVEIRGGGTKETDTGDESEGATAPKSKKI